MTAWVREGVQEEIGVITDYVNPMWVLASPCKRKCPLILDLQVN